MRCQFRKRFFHQKTRYKLDFWIFKFFSVIRDLIDKEKPYEVSQVPLYVAKPVVSFPGAKPHEVS